MNYKQKNLYRNSNVSLFTNALRGRSMAKGYRMLNPTRSSSFIPSKGTNCPLPNLKDFDSIFHSRKEKIYYTRKLTGTQFSVELCYIEDLQKQDLLSWKTEFLKATIARGWNNEFVFDYLKPLTDQTLHKYFESTNSVEEALARLI